MSIKIIATNRKAHFNYEIMENFEAGVVLTGTEIKSLHEGKFNLNEAYGVLRYNEVFLLNAGIPIYSFGSINNHEPTRTRKLLLHRYEIRRLIGLTREKGFTLIPLKAYWSNGKVKIELGLGRGKKLVDKRATIKERDWQRERGRILKDNR